MSIELRAITAADVEALRAMYNRLVAPAPGWTAAEAPAQWNQVAQGDRTRVAVRDGRVVGAVGTVIAPPWLFIWPLVTADEDVAAVLLDAALAHRPDGVKTARIGVRTGEEGKRRAVVARGFVPSIQFHELVHAVRPEPGPQARVEGLTYRRIDHPAMDREAARALHNQVFVEIDNGTALDDADFAQLVDGPTSWRDATAVWVDARGVIAGFVIGLRGEDERGRFGVLEAIGVAPHARGQGLARAMTDWLLGRARAAGVTEVRSTVASTNAGSLALHRAAGFTEAGRKQMYDLTGV